MFNDQLSEVSWPNAMLQAIFILWTCTPSNYSTQWIYSAIRWSIVIASYLEHMYILLLDLEVAKVQIGTVQWFFGWMETCDVLFASDCPNTFKLTNNKPIFKFKLCTSKIQLILVLAR